MSPVYVLVGVTGSRAMGGKRNECHIYEKAEDRCGPGIAAPYAHEESQAAFASAGRTRSVAA